MMTPSALAIILQGAPFPGAVFTVTPGGAALDITIDGATITFCEGAWFAAECRTTPAHLSFATTPTAEQVHAEIRRVLAVLAAEPSPTWAEIKADCVGPDLPAEAIAEILRAHPYPGVTDLVIEDGDLNLTFEGATVPLDGELWRLDGVGVRLDADGWNTSGITRRCLLPQSADLTPDLVHAEISRVLRLAAESPHSSARLDRRLTDEIDHRRDVEAQLAKITDAHAVVSQRLIGAQKEVAERDATIKSKESKIIDLTLRLGQTQNRVGDLESELAGVCRDTTAIRRERDQHATDRTAERAKVKRLTSQHDDWQADVDRARQDADAATARTKAAEAKVKRLLRQRNAAHAVLDEAAIGLEKEGARRWTLARRCRAAVKPVWDDLDTIEALDEIAKIVGVPLPSLSDSPSDSEVVAAVKALRSDDALRAEIAVAVGLDDSASLSLILATVKERSPDLSRLLDYHQAPVKFNDRALTTAERAAFVIRRLWQGRANAASESAALRRELSEITDALAHLPDCAERSPIGQVTEYLNLNAAERIRLALPKK